MALPQDFRPMTVRESKQAEFLLFDNCPWQLIEQIGVINTQIAEQVTAILGQSEYRTQLCCRCRAKREEMLAMNYQDRIWHRSNSS
jgi:hypothetical protein